MRYIYASDVECDEFRMLKFSTQKQQQNLIKEII